MNRLDSKKGGIKPKANIFSENGPLLPVTRQKVIKLRETLKQDKLTPWLWFNSRGVNVNDFYRKTIHISGCLYRQSQALVFFSFIVPFLQDAIVKTLDETLETCRARGLKPEEPHLRETAMVLDGELITSIYDYMVDIDRRIRGKGNPKSVGRKDVTDEKAKMRNFLNECKDEMIRGTKAVNKLSVKPAASGGKAGYRKTKSDRGKKADLVKVPILELIKQGESHTLEFKEILEYETQRKGKNKDTLPSLKTIAGFLNSAGGTLLIGVSNSGEIKGIERDLYVMNRGDNDKFEQKIRNYLKNRFKPPTIGMVNISFEKFPVGTICRIDVQASINIVHLDNRVYVRDGNTTQPLEGRDLTDWIQQRVQTVNISEG